MFFFPLFDDNPAKNFPITTWLIIFICSLIFIYQTSLDNNDLNFIFYNFGVVPAFITLPSNSENLTFIHPYLTLLSSAFLHAGWMHLIGNMLYLWIFGDNVEDSMGIMRFVIFYIICALSAGLLQVTFNPTSYIPMVGASGAIAGVLGSYLVLYPKANVKVFIWIIFFVRTINVPAWIVLGIWIMIQFISLPESLNSQSGGVAYFAHIGGFIAGDILTPFFKKPEKQIFASAHSHSWEHRSTEKSDFKNFITHNKSLSSVPLLKKRLKSSVPISKHKN